MASFGPGFRWSALGIVLSCLSGCSAIRYSDFECGAVWGNERYLHAKDRVFTELHLEIAKKGYVYALAGALVLQRDSREDLDHYFEAPPRLRLVESLGASDSASGFEGNVFELGSPDNPASLTEVIVAFSGSNGATDWVANLLPVDAQYRQARRYLSLIAAMPRYRKLPLIVTGYSLGGALAVNVTKHQETRHLVTTAWIFNPSPRTYVSGEVDSRIWMAAEKGEVLSATRKPFFQIFPGISAIGVPEGQSAERYGMIKSSAIYRHFRWSLLRQLLHIADLRIYLESGGQAQSTEPLEILKASRFAADTRCKDGRFD